MAEPLFWDSKVLLAKIETSYGVDPTPTASILATAVTIRPMEGDDVSRDLERPYMGAQEQYAASLRAVLEFDVELVGSGDAGTAPAWGPLLRMCAMAETIVADTSVTYNPISKLHESGSIYFWVDQAKHILKGIRGTFQVKLTAQQIPKIHFTLTGLWTQPAKASQGAVDFSAWKDPDVATTASTPTFTVNSVAMVLREFTLDGGNDVQGRFLVGVERVLVVDKNEVIDARVEAQHLDVLNPFALSKARTKVPVTLVHGVGSGYVTTISAPLCQVRRLPNYENEQNILEWPLALAPIPDEGNDQFSIALT